MKVTETVWRVLTFEAESVDNRNRPRWFGEYQCPKLIETVQRLSMLKTERDDWEWRVSTLEAESSIEAQFVGTFFLLMLRSRGSGLAVGAKESLVLNKHGENLPA